MIIFLFWQDMPGICWEWKIYRGNPELMDNDIIDNLGGAKNGSYLTFKTLSIIHYPIIH